MNTVGYCIGGTLLATTLAYMATSGDRRIQSATFFAAQTDFKLAGELLVFTDDAGIDYVEDRWTQAGGLLDAQAMADTFNSLRVQRPDLELRRRQLLHGQSARRRSICCSGTPTRRACRKALHLFYLQQIVSRQRAGRGQARRCSARSSTSAT